MRDKQSQADWDVQVQRAVYTILRMKAERELREAKANDPAFQRFMAKVLA